MRLFSRLSVGLFAVALAASPASAQVNYNFTTSGCFYVGSGGCTGVASSSYQGLKYTGVNVTGTSNAAGDLVLGNMGTFTMVTPWPTDVDYTGVNFTLYLAFTAPSSTSPNPGVIQAVLSGVIYSDNNSGTVTVNFDNSAQAFTYDGGTFSLAVDDITGLKRQGGNNKKNVTGAIHAGEVETEEPGQENPPVLEQQPTTEVPEPASLALLAAGALGLGISARTRRRN